jgi:hypothetical protein
MLNFFEQLQNEINEEEKQYEFPKIFVRQNKLRKHTTRINSVDDLPMELSMGVVFFIGLGTIIKSYSWVDFNYSLSMKVNVTKPVWRSKIYIHKISLKDFDNDFYKWISKSTDIEVYDTPSVLYDFVMNLIKSGLQVWLPPKFS